MQKHYLADLIEPIISNLGFETVRILTIGETNPVLQIMIEHKDYNKFLFETQGVYYADFSKIF